MKVEFFYTPGCAKCARAREPLKATAQQVVPGLDWRELNVSEHLDYAIELGVLSLPAMAIDGKLAFTSLPTTLELRTALVQRQSPEV